MFMDDVMQLAEGLLFVAGVNEAVLMSSIYSPLMPLVTSSE